MRRPILTFETAVLRALRGHGMWQRLDALLCEPEVIRFTPWFCRYRLRRLVRMGLIERGLDWHDIPVYRATPGRGRHWQSRCR